MRAYFLVPWLSTEDKSVQSAFNIRCGIDMDKNPKYTNEFNQVNSVVEKLLTSRLCQREYNGSLF